jgi:acetyl-CoA carboxylase biotin carboxyl carrier protein
MADKDQMDLNKVKELVALMRDNDLAEIELTDGKNRIHLKRPQPVQPVISQVPMGMMPMMAPQPGAFPAASSTAGSAPAASHVPQEKLLEITSPIIGTFYSAPSPDSDPYVKAGDRIKPDTVVCIVEAMKVMNEIKAEITGTLVEVLCRAGQPVEFGQVLFRVRPD